MARKGINSLIDEVPEIVILEKPKDKDSEESEERYRFAIPFRGDFARKRFEETLALDNWVPQFCHYWHFDKKTGQINGSSVFLQLRLSRVLRRFNLELPDNKDFIELINQGKLKRQDNLDAGIAIFDDEEPNKKLASSLVSFAKNRKLKYPLIWSPGDLDYFYSRHHPTEEEFWINPQNIPRRVISGENARTYLGSYCKGVSGMRRIQRYLTCGMDASSERLDHSNPDFWIRWVCGEGNYKELTSIYMRLFKGVYKRKEKELRKQLDSLLLEQDEKIIRAVRSL